MIAKGLMAPLNEQQGGGITRRGAIAAAVALGGGVGLDRMLARGAATSSNASWPASSDQAIPFDGPHPPGIATAAQDYLLFAALDVTTEAVDDLREILVQWSAAARALMAGRAYPPTPQLMSEPPADPGEAIGLGPARLTITIGFGPSLFGLRGSNRFGLARHRPAELQSLPPFRGDSLELLKSDGDLCVQACADDPQVAFHAVHLMSRLAADAATVRYTQMGFGRTSSTSRSQQTPRNLMGFKDGTENIRAEDTQGMADFVWVQKGDGPAWMVGGTYLIARRIRILFDVWDTTSLEGQQRVFGREKLSGAPLGGRGEYDSVDLHATAADGELVIPTDAHIRLASPQYNAGQRILRRGYSYCESVEPGSGQIDAGLYFICFQRSPSRQFIPIQRRLAASDALNKHTLHTSSAIFACPPSSQPGGFVGEGLFT